MPLKGDPAWHAHTTVATKENLKAGRLRRRGARNRLQAILWDRRDGTAGNPRVRRLHSSLLAAAEVQGHGISASLVTYIFFCSHELSLFRNSESLGSYRQYWITGLRSNRQYCYYSAYIKAIIVIIGTTATIVPIHCALLVVHPINGVTVRACTLQNISLFFLLPE